jgi:hypothetical protein
MSSQAPPTQNTNPIVNGSVPITSYMQGLTTNPMLPSGGTLTPTLQQVQTPELMTGQTAQVNPTGANAAPLNQVQPNTIQQTQAQASTVNPTTALAAGGITPQTAQTGNQYQATTVGAAQGTAAQMQVNPLDTVTGQLNALYNSIDSSSPPPWATGALAIANSQMAARGMGASSVGSAAQVAAVQQSAIQIASSDAATYFQTDLANLSNQQQTALQNTQNQQQSLLSDQAATNAAAQFNASSAQQMQQFVSSLVQNTLTQNASMLTAMSQFNAGQANTIAATNAQNQIQTGEFNTQQQSAIEQFNSSLQNQREQFNAQNAFAVEQSNVTWQRTVNTANTAAVNAANQTNVQNAYNLSTTALNNIWQQYLDESSWIFQGSQNQNTINANIAMASNNQNFILQQQGNAQNAAFLSQIGQFAGSLLVGGS